jgi:transcriptional regulator with XRE-family HTH domain
VDEFVKKLGKSISEKRKAAGLSQVAFALKCDMDKQALNRIENGRTSPTLQTLRLIAKELNIHVRDLLDFE